MKRVTKEQIKDFRARMEATMREMKDKHGNPCVTESEIKEHCIDTPDDYIAHLIENNTKPDYWAELVTMY